MGASAIRRRLQASAARGLTPFVGRQQEVPPLPIDITAERNTFSKMGFFAIYITPQKAPQGGPSATMGPIVIQENTMTDPPAVSSGYAMTLNSSDPSGPAPPSVLVANNYVLGKFGGIQVGVTPLATVRGNTVELGPPCCGAIGINFVHDPVSVVGSGSITGNTVLYALQPFDYAASPTVTVCGNRTTETGGYDQPAPCP